MFFPMLQFFLSSQITYKMLYRRNRADCPPPHPDFLEEVTRSVTPSASHLHRGTPPSISEDNAVSSPTSDECGKERFQCQVGECVFSSFVCDGEVGDFSELHSLLQF